MARPEMLEPKEVFRRVFLELGFPILSLDLTDLQTFVAHPDAKEGSTYDGISELDLDAALQTEDFLRRQFIRGPVASSD